MDSLKSKLPTIEIKSNDYFKKTKSTVVEKNKKEKFLDKLLNKDFLNKYFKKDEKLNKKTS